MTLVLKLGAFPPTVNGNIVEEQLRIANRYRNKLVEIERERRRMIREAEEPYGLRSLEEIAKTLGIRCKKLEDATSDADKSELKELTCQLRDVRTEMARLREDPALVARMLEINGKPKKKRDPNAPKLGRAAARNADKTPNNGISAKAVRAARAASGVFWGTYLCVEDAARRSFSDIGGPYDGDEDNDPKWSRFNGEGTLGVQIQKGKPLDIFGNDARVSIVPVDDLALTSPKRSERRNARPTMLRMAIAGDARGKHEYVCAEWPILLHRPIPSDAVIKYVKVSRHKTGPCVKWSCEITLDRTAPIKPPPPDEGTLAVVFGWRVVEGNKVRVAQWLSTTKGAGVLDLSCAGLEPKVRYAKWHKAPTSPYTKEVDGGRSGIISGFRRVEELSSIRKKNFSKARDELVDWLRTLPKVPEWVRLRTSRDQERIPTSAQALAYMGKWEAYGKLAALVIAWRDNRIPGDVEALQAAEGWRYNDYHLWQWEESQRKSSSRRRNNVYRTLAAGLANTHSRMLVDGTNFKDLREKEEREVSKQQSDKAKSMAQIVSPGILRDSFKNAATQRGKEIEEVCPDKTATRCPKCGLADKSHKHVDGHMFACSVCGLTRDITTIRLMNMLCDDGHTGMVLEIIRRQDAVVEQLKRGGTRRDGRPNSLPQQEL